jgi:hypothetical protein
MRCGEAAEVLGMTTEGRGGAEVDSYAYSQNSYAIGKFQYFLYISPCLGWCCHCDG